MADEIIRLGPVPEESFEELETRVKGIGVVEALTRLRLRCLFRIGNRVISFLEILSESYIRLFGEVIYNHLNLGVTVVNLEIISAL